MCFTLTNFSKLATYTWKIFIVGGHKTEDVRKLVKKKIGID